MKFAISVAIAGLLISTGPASAQSVTAPAAAPQAAPAGFTLDTPIQDIAANPAGRAVLDKDLPTLRSNPSYEQFKMLSLTELVPYSDGKLTPQLLARTQSDLARLPSPK